MNTDIRLINALDDMHQVSRLLNLAQLALSAIGDSDAAAVSEGIEIAAGSLDVAIGRLREMGRSA